MGAADEFVGAVAAPADLPVQLGRGVSDDAVFGIEARLLAKAAADIADQHAHAVLRPLQDGFREQVAGRAGGLRLHVQDQPAGLLLDLGNRRTWLHRRGHQPLADQIERDRVRGPGKGFLDLGGVAIAHGGDDVVGRLGPHHGCAWFHRLDGIDHRRQHLVIDLDRLGRGLRQHPRRRDHRRHRLAGVAHDFMGQQPPRRHRHRLAVRPLEDRKRREGADIVLHEVGTGIDGLHPGHIERGLGIDRLDPGVGMRRAQHIEPQRALLRLVVDELPLPGEQSLVFQTLDRLARTKTHIAGKNVHQFVLRASCRIGRGFSGFSA